MQLFCKTFILLILLSYSSISAFDTTQIIFHFHGPNNNAKIGLKLKNLGDINNDGFDDISISSRNPVGAYIFFGSNPVDTFPDMFLNGSIQTEPIDLTGDGQNDIITSLVLGDNFGALYFYQGFTDSIASLPYDSIYKVNNNFGFGWKVSTGYVDTDSLGDLLTYQPNTLGGPILYYYSGYPAIDTIVDWSFKVEGFSHSYSDFGFIDFNGDNNLDIYLGMYADLDTVSSVFIFYGPNFNNVPDRIIGVPDTTILDPELFAAEVKNIGDINNDNWDDLGVLFNNKFLIYLCGPSVDALFDYWMKGDSYEFSKAGDINGDGFNDLVSGEGRSADGNVDVYLGGNELDPYFDLSIYRFDLPNLALDRIGFEVSSAGDFNGDGYDDFMFSCQNFNLSSPFDVFIISGSPNITTDIEYDYEPNLPDNFDLKQNYPNPFNPSTTIEFAIPQRDHITLSIYNTLGQKIRTLINKPLSVGSYSLVWDGKNEGGNFVSSGMYLYKLETAENIISKKMVLLK